MKELILSIDQGTTGTTVLVLDSELNVLSKKNNEFPQYYPQPGWVEHDSGEIWESTVKTMDQALIMAQADPSRIAAIGITNQRETTTVWHRSNSKPIHKSIVWQDRRTAPFCAKLKKEGKEKFIRAWFPSCTGFP